MKVMECVRFSRLALGLLFVLNAIRGSHALSQQDWEMKKNGLMVNAENAVSAQKELLVGFTTINTRKMSLGGTKMAAGQKVVSRKEKKVDQQGLLHGGASEDNSGANYAHVKCDFEVVQGCNKFGDQNNYSPTNFKNPAGKENNASERKSFGGSHDDQMDNLQKDMNNLEGNTFSAGLGTPRTKPTHDLLNAKQKLSQDSKARLENPASKSEKLLSQQEPGNISPKDEMQRLLDKEFANLMNKDYTSPNPRRHKPPINNNAPIH